MLGCVWHGNYWLALVVYIGLDGFTSLRSQSDQIAWFRASLVDWIMFFYWIILFGLLFQHATCQWPGPQKTTKDQNGNEVWVAQGLKNGPAFTYTGIFPFRKKDHARWIQLNILNSIVQDLGKARPTLVYNCAQAPAICQTVKKYWDNGQTEGQFHYDKDYRLGGKRNHKGVRKSRRRDTNCPHTWKNRHTCPEQNQPKFQAEGMGWTDAVLWKGVWGDQNPEDNRLAQKKSNLKRKSDGTGKQQWEKIGIILTCDEWPAAR